MTATIVKSSTTVNVLDDFTIDLKNDGGLDTAVIRFYSTNNALLDRYDRVTFNGKTWRVASQPTARINTETSPEWLYTVELIEKAALLKGYPMPNFTFTQDLAQTKTYRDALKSGCLKVETLFTGDSPRFTIKASPTVSLSGIAPDEKFEGIDFYQFLKYYAEILDAKFEIDESDVIDFLPLNSYTDTIAPDMKVIELSKPTDDYATDIIMDITNADTEISRRQVYPQRQTEIYLLPQDITEDVDSGATSSYDNLRITTPFKIKKLVSLTVYDKKTPKNAFTLVSEPDGTIYTTKFIFEKQEWETLRQSTITSFFPGSYLFTGSLRENSVYWTYGENEIGNLKALQAHIIDLSAYARDLSIRVVYDILPDIQIKQSSETTLDDGYTFTERQNQNGNTVSLTAENNRIFKELRNKRTAYYNVRWRSTTIPSVRSRVTVLGQNTLITWLRAERVGAQYDISARLATIYNKRSPLTKIISENRIFTIPNQQTTVRKIVWNQNAVISLLWGENVNSATKWASYHHNLLFNFQDSGGSYYDGQAIAVVRFKYADSATYVCAAMPIASFSIDDHIVNIFRMISNTAVDWQSYRKFTAPVVSTAQTAIVTDENGENEAALVKYMVLDTDMIVDSTTSTIFQDGYPFIGAGRFNAATYDSKYNNFAICDELQLNKDRREQLQFEHHLVISGGSLGTSSRYTGATTVNPSAIRNSSKFRAALAETEVDLRLTIFNGSITMLYTVVATPVFYDGYIRLNYTAPESGTVSKVEVINHVTSDVLLSRNINNQSVTKGVAYHVTITIKES